jgi:glycosyltransferase involved in cell wall biosynthesis
VTPPSITIITPTLNADRYLAECLTSVRDQQYPRVQHLVIDGGSVDGTENVVRAQGAVWIARPGLSQTAAINAGFRLATGDIIAWLNADDLYVDGCLSRVAACFASDPRLDAVYGDCDVIGEHGERLWRERPGAYNFERLLKRGNSLAQPAVFLHRRVFERIGYLDESLDLGMDYELWLRLRGLRVLYLPRVLAAFRWHPGSKTARNTSANWHELMLIVRRHGGGWTPQLMWSFARARFTAARKQVMRGLNLARWAAAGGAQRPES